MAYTLFWMRSDFQGSFNMGTYPTEEDARAAIPTAKAELIGQCGEDYQKQEIEDGSWSIQADEIDD